MRKKTEHVPSASSEQAVIEFKVPASPADPAARAIGFFRAAAHIPYFNGLEDRPLPNGGPGKNSAGR
jgi:hypothetical protein